MKLLKKLYYEKYTKKSYSISNVDLIIDRIFAKKNKGIYIDIGCNHPIKFNNTYLLHKRGWNGINVDLDKKSINEFNKLRPKDHNVEALVSSSKGEIKEVYYYHERSAINTLSKELADKRTTKPRERVKIKANTINEIIDNSPFANKKIDLLSIDIENHEFEAMKNFKFEKYNIDIIVTEITNLMQKKLEIYCGSISQIVNSDLYKLMIKNNYKLINWVNSDLVFVKEGFDERI